MTDKRISKIVIVGGGTAGWMTAAAMAKILGTARHSITLVESEMIGTVGVALALATVTTVIGHRYFHPFGHLGVDMDGIGFMHFWARWNRNGGGLDYPHFNAETEGVSTDDIIARLLRETPKHEHSPA